MKVVPRLLVLTDRLRSEACGRSLVETVSRAVAAGAPAVVLREKDLPRGARRALALELSGTARTFGARLLVAGDLDLATGLGAGGIHLAADDPTPGEPPPGTGGLLMGRSCHTPAEVRTSVHRRHDYVTVSPVACSDSKPGYGPALGADGLAQAVRAAGGLPVLALGGVTPTNVSTWIGAGAHGVAVMGGVMGARDPGASVRSLLDELPTEDP